MDPKKKMTEKKEIFGTRLKQDFFRISETSPKLFLEKCSVALGGDDERMRDLKDNLLGFLKGEIRGPDLIGQIRDDFGFNPSLICDLEDWLSSHQKRDDILEEKKKNILEDEEEEILQEKRKKKKVDMWFRRIISRTTSSDMCLRFVSVHFFFFNNSGFVISLT